VREMTEQDDASVLLQALNDEPSTLLVGCLLPCTSKRLFVGLAVLVDDGWAMLVKPRFVAELAEQDAFLRR
jgi:hypothetical protein